MRLRNIYIVADTCGCETDYFAFNMPEEAIERFVDCVRTYEKNVDDDILQDAVLNQYYISHNEINKTEIIKIY